MTTKLKQLLAEREVLDQKISELQAVERSEAISKVLALISEHGLTQKDILTSTSSAKSRKTSGVKVAAKYKDPLSGNEWSGRGMTPKWLANKNREDFLIA